YDNQITNLNLTNTMIASLSIHNNPLTSFTYHCTSPNGSGAMAFLALGGNLTELNLTGNILVLEGSFHGTSLDFSNLYYDLVDITAPNLTYFNAKNGVINTALYLDADNLQYICADEIEVGAFSFGFPDSVQINSYCSFTPGGEYNI